MLPRGWDASPLQGYPQQYVTGTHLYTWVKRDNVEQSFLSKETRQQWRDQPGLEPTTLRSSDRPIESPARYNLWLPPHLHRTRMM